MPTPREEMLAKQKQYHVGLINGILLALDPAGVNCYGPAEYRSYAVSISNELDKRDREQTYGHELDLAKKIVGEVFPRERCGYPDAFYNKASELISYVL